MIKAAATQALAGRREAALTSLPSVERLVGVLGERCRDASWIRTSVASLDRFAQLTGASDLEALLARARSDPSEADRSLLAFAAALDGYARSQVAALAIGPKLWFTFNGVPVAWEPLPGSLGHPAAPGTPQPDRLVLLAMIGSGLHLSELLRARVEDAGALDADGHLVPGLIAEPLALRFRDVRARRDYVTFLTYGAREALLADLTRRGATLRDDSPLVLRSQGRRFNRALIRTCNNANVELCRTTGDFFRAWGRPGARFSGPEVFSSWEDV